MRHALPRLTSSLLRLSPVLLCPAFVLLGRGQLAFYGPTPRHVHPIRCPMGSDYLSPRNSNAFFDCFVFPCALMILLYVITFGCKPFCRISFRSSTAFVHYLAFPHALTVNLRSNRPPLSFQFLRKSIDTTNCYASLAYNSISFFRLLALVMITSAACCGANAASVVA